MSARKSNRPKKPLWRRLLEAATAIVATVNFGLVLFDLSYIPSRHFLSTGRLPLSNPFLSEPWVIIPDWLVVPNEYEFNLTWLTFFTRPLTEAYDGVKGIAENPDTQKYLDKFQELQTHNINSPEARNLILELQNLSLRMIAEDPFELSGQSGTLEKIQNRMRGFTKLDSSEQAFGHFWTPGYLIGPPSDEETALEWFDENIIPFIERSNYIRKIDKSGEFVNRFFGIDALFRVWFLLEFVTRVWFIKRRSQSLSWRDAIFKRWYDFFLVLPLTPVMLWLRVFPVIVRLREAGVNFEPLRSQVSRGFVAVFASELTEVIALQTISQVQSSIRQGEISSWLLESSQRDYIDLNDTNEVELISRRLAKLVVYNVLPHIQPDIEALLQRNVELAFNQSELYQTLQKLPGVGTLPLQISKPLVAQLSKLITEVSQGAYDTFTADDPVVSELIDRLSQNFRESFTAALQDQETLRELQTLLTDLLEEVKVNYVQRLSEDDFDRLLEEAEKLRGRG
jgi:hypothetical protein